MKITKVKVFLVEPKDSLVGYAKCTLDDEFLLKSIGIHKKLGKQEYRLTYPKKGDEYVFHPMTKNASKAVEEAIICEFKNVIRKEYDRYCSSEYTSE